MTALPVPIKERLLKGAVALGKLWKEQVRCDGGWSLECPCATKTKFCNAKRLWCNLVFESGRPHDTPDPTNAFWVVGQMLRSEFEAADIVAVVEVPGIGPIRVGKHGDVPFSALTKTDVAGLASVSLVLRAFPGAVVRDGKGAL